MEGGRNEAQEGLPGNGPHPFQQRSPVRQVSAPEPRGWVYCSLPAPPQNGKLGLPSGPLREYPALWALRATNCRDCVLCPRCVCAS